MIEPRTLKGFRDYLPEAMIPREALMETARRVYRSFGFAPIDTPTLEYLEVLNGKAGEESDRQLYQFVDHGDRHVGMRFDLTVPLARFAAQHINELGTPFKRYHIATVWRGESPQRGRYREFIQCDFDTIGTRSVAADIETAVVIHQLLLTIGLDSFQIRINHRGVLNGLLETLNLADQSEHVLRAIDKLAKVGPDKVVEEMTRTAGASPEQARRVLQLTSTTGAADEVLGFARDAVAASGPGREGVQRLEQILAGFAAATEGSSRLCVDLSIARGLDYYTGVVFETFLDELPEIGSVCSGGRYDDLASLFTRQELPGIGASLGLDRLLAALESLGRLRATRTPAPVLMVYFAEPRLNDYLRIAARIRGAGIGVEFYPDAKKIGDQLKYAARRGFRLAVVIGEDEFTQGQCQLKCLGTRQSSTLPLSEDCRELIAAISSHLAAEPDNTLA